MSDRSTTIGALRAGAVLTLLSACVTVALSGDLADQLHALYPADPTRAETAESSILTYLFALEAIGLGLWWWTARAVRNGKPRARALATGAFVAGTALSLYHFTQPHPFLMTLAGALPSLAGLVAVILLWSRNTAAAT
ncbi:hypothetical protein [Streptomyces sp. NPDC056061]|uniref:hypothetical protein n=1 Tax=Streptomyces sp. NPDC056061 TaxID=3345700 RepID=UPI0035DD47F7